MQRATNFGALSPFTFVEFTWPTRAGGLTVPFAGEVFAGRILQPDVLAQIEATWSGGGIDAANMIRLRAEFDWNGQRHVFEGDWMPFDGGRWIADYSCNGVNKDRVMLYLQPIESTGT